jgi:hypothetical protein
MEITTNPVAYESHRCACKSTRNYRISFNFVKFRFLLSVKEILNKHEQL